MTDIVSDLVFGIRMLRKRPGTTALAVMALALGIGLTTTMFSIVQGVFLRGLPFDESDRLVAVTSVERGNAGRAPVRISEFLDLVDARSQSSFDALAAFRTQSASVSGDFLAERARLVEMTPNTLGLLRVAPAVGRDFTPADAAPGAARVAMISHRLWQSAFYGDHAAINRVIRVNGMPTTIVGVAPERFGFPLAQDLWMPLSLARPATRSDAATVEVIGRLRPNVSLDAADVEVEAIASRAATSLTEKRTTVLDVQPYIDHFLGREVITALTAMLGAVFGVMLIACANVTNLQLARAAERTREVGVRTALGAARHRIVRQFLLEGFLVAATGAIIGLVLARVAMGLFTRAIADTSPPFWIDIRIDLTVLAFVSALTAIAAIVASLAPALRATRLDTNAVLKDDGRGTTGLRLGRFGRTLVLVEVIVSCCLLVVSGFMLRNVIASATTTYPYETERVLAASFTVNNTQYETPEARRRLGDDVQAAVRSIPGITAVAVGTGAPENGCCSRRIAAEGVTYSTAQERPTVRYRVVTPSYFDVLGIRPIVGRVFDGTDSTSAAPAVVITADLANRLFGGVQATDRRINLATEGEPLWRTVVGVVPQLVAAEQDGRATGMVFAPLAQSSDMPSLLLLSTAGDPLALAAPVRSQIAMINPDLALFSVNSLRALYYEQDWAIRVFGTLFMAFGAAALLLAMAGLYGVMAFNVRQRTAEIGVRMALGATRSNVVGMVLWQGMWRVIAGLVVGFVPAWWLGGLLGSTGFNLSAEDPIVYGAAAAAIVLAGAAASLVPALRAASVDPLVALRRD